MSDLTVYPVKDKELVKQIAAKLFLDSMTRNFNNSESCIYRNMYEKLSEMANDEITYNTVKYDADMATWVAWHAVESIESRVNSWTEQTEGGQQ